MKSYKINTIFLCKVLLASVVLFTACNSKKNNTNQDEQPKIEELYFGLKPPGLTPEVFAPTIVSTDNLEVLGVFSPEMDEFYFTRQLEGESPKNIGVRYRNGEWEKIYEESRTGEIFISPDNSTMFLGNTYKERTTSGWSEAKSLGLPYDEISIMRLTSSTLGTYVFDEFDTIGTLRMSRLKDGIREEPEELDGVFKEGTFIAHPFIAPDESYIIWDYETENGYGSSDLYISFRQEDGSWGKAINMGAEINSEMEDSYGSVTADGKFFVFHRVNLGETYDESYANIFWVDAQAIFSLKNKN